MFGPEEKDYQNSANFLIILLASIEKWASTFKPNNIETTSARS